MWKREPLFRQLEILKLLQDNPMRTEEIGNYFRSPNNLSNDSRTTQKDLEALRDGVEILETVVKVTEETRSHSIKYYK